MTPLKHRRSVKSPQVEKSHWRLRNNDIKVLRGHWKSERNLPNEKRVVTGCIIAAAIVLTAIAGTLYVSYRLPPELGLDRFAKGIIATELKNEPFAQVAPQQIFFKEGRLKDVMNYLEENSLVFEEQFGAYLLFTRDGQKVDGTLKAITRWHRLLTIDD